MSEPDATRANGAVVVVVVVQAIFWLLTASVMDGGVACGVYSRILLGYWIVVGAVYLVRVARGRSFGRVVGLTGWAPPAGCLLWAAGVL